MAKGLALSRLRLPAFLANGFIRAYALVLGLTLACAAVVYARSDDRPVQPAEAAEAFAAPTGDRRGSLKLPPSSQLKVDFRQLPASERDDLIQVTADGQRLPKISATGWMPWIAYSRRFDPRVSPARVGLLMLNLGADEALMRRAIEELPGEVSLAFLPCTPDWARWLALGRQHGHECYLMLPV